MNYYTHNLSKIHCLRNSSGPVDQQGKYITHIFTDEVSKLLVNSTKPQFTYLAYNAPHLPVSAPDWIKNKLRDEYRKMGHQNIQEYQLEFDGAVRVVDYGIKKLYEQAKTLDRETIFIFTR